jgi:hypothetical protein
MRNLVVCLLMVISLNCHSQFNESLGVHRDCGTWVVKRKYITEWQSVDTVNYCKKCDTAWAYTEWMRNADNYNFAVYCPCGCGWDIKKNQRRVNLVGIIQERWDITEFEYKPKPKSEYEQKIDSLKTR